MTLESVFADWSLEDRENLGVILRTLDSTPVGLQDAIWRLYNNRLRKEVERWSKDSFGRVLTKLGGEARSTSTERDHWRRVGYQNLLIEACRQVRVNETGSVEEQERFLIQRLFVRALNGLKARELDTLLGTTVDLEKVAAEGKMPGPNLKGQVGTLGAIGAAQASGFGVYLMASTLLGAATSAAGVTLSFAVYTGLAKAISLAIGPPGWAALAGFTFIKLTGPNWKDLMRAMIYIITVRTRPREPI